MQGDRSNRIDRRGFLKIAGKLAAGLGLAACAPAAAPTATPTKAPSAATSQPGVTPSPVALRPEAIRAQLYEAAKKEGQVLMYLTGTSKDTDAYRKVFTKTYPGIELKDYTGTNEGITEKMLTEGRAGKVNVDAFILPMVAWGEILKAGLAEKWESPEKENYPPEAVDPGGVWVLQHAAIHVISYNTQAIPASEAPKSYQDLLKPYFKGKLGLESESYSLFTQRARIWGRDKTIEYFRQLAAQQPKLMKGHTTLADAVASGEVSVAVNVFQHRVEDQKSKGAPVKWVADEPTGTEPQAIAVSKGSPHPNAARLLMDWMLSEEGQTVVLRDLSRYSARKGFSIPADLQVKAAYHGPDIAAEVEANVKTFKEIFGLI